MEHAHAGHTGHGSRGSSEGLGFLAEMLDLDVEITRSYWDGSREVDRAGPSHKRSPHHRPRCRNRRWNLRAGRGDSTMPRSSPSTRQMRCWNEFARKHWTVESQNESKLSRPTSTPTGQKPDQLMSLGHQCSCTTLPMSTACSTYPRRHPRRRSDCHRRVHRPAALLAR